MELRFQSVLPGACGERPFTLRVEASNANGTDEETIDLIADWPIC